MSKQRPNSPCLCGSGKKDKKCCRKSDLASRFDVPNRKLRVVARVASDNGTKAGFEIQSASVSIGNRAVPVIQEPISLSTGGLSDLKPTLSESSISMAIDGTGDGTAKVTGNASIIAKIAPPSISIRDRRKKLEASVPNELFALARLGHQRDTGRDYVDLIFGRRGQPEEVDKNGSKLRPHVTLFADGNGKFFRFGGIDCDISTTMQLYGLTGTLAPNLTEISLPGFSQKLELKYSILEDGSISLESLQFSPKE